MLPVGWLELGSTLQEPHGAVSVPVPSVLTGLECALRKGIIRERERRVADRDGKKLVKGWLVAAWMVLIVLVQPRYLPEHA